MKIHYTQLRNAYITIRTTKENKKNLKKWARDSKRSLSEAGEFAICNLLK